MEADLLRTVDVFLEGTKKPLVVILGPTASGKTAFSIKLAKHIDGEIVNGDSRQIYQYLNIGTAKITSEEMQGIAHHLIDVKDPKEEITVGWYQREASKVIDAVHSRGKVPLLVGGSMLYISTITDGLSLVPAADSALRERLMTEYQEDGGARLYKRLQKIDPEAAAGIHQNNMPRLVRALEIYEVLKAPKSQTVSARGELRPRGEGSERCVYDLLIFGVERSPEELKKRMQERTEQMLDAGWIDEVQALLAQGYTAEDPGMKSHGYRDIITYLAELEAAGSDADLDAMRAELTRRIVTKTRQYAKRQMTWWRGDERMRWVQV